MGKIVNCIKGWDSTGAISIASFLFLGIALVFFSMQIVKNTHVLNTKSKFSGGLIGGVLLALITASPEFITSIEQSLIDNPGAGTADVIGANAISGFAIAISAVIFIRETFMRRLKSWTIISLWISFVCSLTITLVMFFKADINIGIAGKYAIGIFPIILFLIFLTTTYLQSKFGKETNVIHQTPYIKKTTKQKAWFRFIILGFFLIIVSIIINWFAASIEQIYNIPSESVGGLFLSFIMSLPELIAFFSMMRAKQYITAIAILIGHGFALFFAELLGDLSFVQAATYTTQGVHDNWALSLITTIIFFFLALLPILTKKFKLFQKKYAYLTLPFLAIFTYIIGWILILSIG